MPGKAQNKLNLTKDAVDSFPHPSSGYVIYWDTQVHGLGVRVTPTKKTYILQTWIGKSLLKKSLGTHPEMNPTQARIKAGKIKVDIVNGEDPRLSGTHLKKPAAAGVTLQEVFDKYISTHKLKPKTLTVYTGALKRCFGEWLDLPLANITEAMIQEKHKKISETVGERSNETGAQAQANQAMRVLRTLFNYAMREYKVNSKPMFLSNPVARLSQEKSWNKNKRRQSVIKSHQLKAWFDAVDNLTDAGGRSDSTMRDYIILCLFTGLRRSEAAGLKWSDVDLHEKSLRVEDTKNGEDHMLPLSSYINDMLKKRHLESKTGAVYVFPGNGRTGHIVESKRAINAVRKESGVNFMMHDLRRTFITMAESLDIPYYSLKKLLNHKTTASDVTSGYIVVDMERLRSLMQKISDHILDITGRQTPPAKVTRLPRRKLEVV